MGLCPFGTDAARPLDRPFVPHTLKLSHGSPAPLVKFQRATRHRLLTSSGSKKIELKYYCLSKYPVNEPPPPPPGSPTGPQWRDLPVSRAFFCITLGFPNKQGLLIKQNLTVLWESPVKNVPSMLPNGAPTEKDARFQSHPIRILQGPK